MTLAKRLVKRYSESVLGLWFSSERKGFVVSDDGIHYGVSFRNGPANWLDCLRRFPEGALDAVELGAPPDRVEASMDALDGGGVEWRGLANPYPSSLTRSVPDESVKIQWEFIKSLANLLAGLRPIRFDAMSMDFGLESGFDHPDRRDARVRCLKSLAPILSENRITLSLPMRIPFESPGTGEGLLRILTESLGADLRIRLNVRPHELPKDFSPEALTRWVKFDIAQVAFVYEADLGNRLVAKLIKPWVAFLRDIRFKGAVLFAPRAESEELFLVETERCLELVDR